MTDWKIYTRSHQYVSPYIGTDSDREWKKDFYFVLGADPQFGMKNPATADWTFEMELAELAVEKVNKINPKPRFFIICGDLTNEFPTLSEELKNRQIADFKRIFSKVHSDIPLICVCGNHDIGHLPTVQTIEKYRSTFGDDYFSFWCGGVFFIVLNSQLYWNPWYVEEMAEKQDQWLDAQLEEGAAAYQIVCFSHIPWFVEKFDENDSDYNIPYATRMRLLEKLHNAGVRHFFSGHYHRNGGGKYKDMEMVVTSAIGLQCGSDASGLRLVRVSKVGVNHAYWPFENASTSD